MRTSDRPPCTFLIPIFNGGSHLGRITQNIFSMANLDDEILFVNDGSDDLSGVQWKEFESTDSRIRVVHLPHRGIVAALNEGIKHSAHDFIARIDVDDSYHPDRITRQFEKFLDVPNCGVVFCDYEFIDAQNGNKLGVVCGAIHPTLSSLALANPQRMPHPAALISKKALLQVGGYLDDDSPCEDYGLWLRMAKEFQIVSVPLTLLNYSITAKSLTSINAEKMNSKVRELRLKHLPSILFDVRDEQILSEYFKYESVSDIEERKVLAFRDLMTVSKMGIRRFGAKVYLRIALDLLVHMHYVILAIFRIKSKQTNRNRIRHPSN